MTDLYVKINRKNIYIIIFFMLYKYIIIIIFNISVEKNEVEVPMCSKKLALFEAQASL